MQGSWEPDFFVADWRVRPALGKLERGDLAISVEARSLQVLACLTRHAPNVVSKQRLIREVWGEEAFVTEEVLSHAIWELRKAFGDEARNPRFIQTIARKGYRLLVEVSFGTAPELLAAGSRIANYEILAPLEGGAMGEVYKARDLRLGRVVALKFLPAELSRDPGARRRFLREAQAVALLDHPNVATLYEAGESEGGRVFLALAFYEGETLQQKLAGGPLPLSEALAIARQIAQGLAAAHRRQIVHRDVKPANVVVLPNGMVKLLDFGLAKMAGATTLTRLGSSPGTPAYKSPEQTRGEKVDPRSDLWALGVVFYEMLTGRVPFGGEYEQAVIYAILNEPPRSLDGEGIFPSELAAVIERALAKDPAARYATAEDLEEDLARIPLGSGGEVTAPRRPMRVRRRLRQRAVWAAVTLAVLVVFGSLVDVWQRGKHRWDFGLEVARLVKQGDHLEWRGDTEPILHNAEGAYRQALAQDRDNPLIQAQLAALLARLQAQFPAADRLSEIRRLVARSVEHAPDHAMPWVAQTKLLLLEDKPREAEQAARKAVDRDPDFDRGYTVLGEALIAQGRLEEGLAEIRHGVEVGDGFIRARLILAIKLRAASRYEEAATELQKVLAYDADHPTAIHNLGLIYLRSGRNLDALPLLRKAFEVTRDARSANSLGFAYFNLDRMQEAIATFAEAHRLDPDLPSAAHNLGESYDKIGNQGQARRWYAVALGLYDRSLARGGLPAELLAGRAFCAAKLGRYEEALRDTREALRLNPKASSLLFQAAQICALAGRRQDAYDYVRQAVQAGYSREELRRDLALRAFQDDPEFRAILEAPAK
jgi:tetratricopeptide (TPR) repeat protein/DNA-binding winged helix-turn-helix (wHTH) protein